MREIELDILANSRLAVANSYYLPIIIGCIIVSVIYGAARLSYINLFLIWIWILLAGIGSYKFMISTKRIKELRKNGS